MALAHKGLSANRSWCFTRRSDRSAQSEKVPVLIDGETRSPIPGRSAYLEVTYPERPSLFRARARAMGRMLTVVERHRGRRMFPLIVIPRNLKPVDADVFRKTREACFGKPAGRSRRRAEKSRGFSPRAERCG